MAVKSKLNRFQVEKLCKKCNEKVEVSKYYKNRDWSIELFLDSWCKICVNKFVIDETTLKEYCLNNKRLFRYELWEWATNKANEVLEEDNKYLKMPNSIKKTEIFNRQLVKLYFQHMNRIQYYRSTNSMTEHEAKELKIERKQEKLTEAHEGVDLSYGSKTYSKVWCGYYTFGELEYLETYFNALQRDFKLENSAYIDYARKVCKASLSMDKAFSDMMEGRQGSDQRYKNSKDIFDTLSQSAKFAEKTRSEHDSVGFGSLGEIIKRMENTGFLQNKIVFPKDEIDKIIDDYRWIITSVGESFDG